MFNLNSDEKLLLKEWVFVIIFALTVTFSYDGTVLYDITVFIAQLCIIAMCQNIMFYLFAPEEDQEQNEE